MEAKDVVISPVSIEDPIIHIIAINDLSFNIAIELSTTTLLGASINSVNSEYRQFNLNGDSVNRIFKSTADKRLSQLFHRARKSLTSTMKKDTIAFEKDSLRSVTHRGIDYAIMYYLILKRFNFTEEQYVNMNSFTNVVPILTMFDRILDTRLVTSDLRAFVDYILTFDNVSGQLGSKLLTITHSQIQNTSVLTQSLWKSMYINRILRTISINQRQHYFSPSLDWGLVRSATKHLFTNEALIARVAFGENIQYIRTTAVTQHTLASALISDHSLDDIKRYSMKLKEATIDLDYILNDLALVMFYTNTGDTIFNSINAFIEETKLNDRLAVGHFAAPIILKHEVFKQIIFQYLYAIFLLAKHGIIHNDPHLNNILVSSNQSKEKCDYQLPSGKIISMGYCAINVTVIDYDKSVLSHRHSRSFEESARIINEEMGIVFETIKKSIVDDYDQIFNCYAMYDVVKFALILMRLLDDLEESIGAHIDKAVLKLNREFLQKMIRQSTNLLEKIYEPNAKLPFDVEDSYGSLETMILKLFESYVKVNKTKSSKTNTIFLKKVSSTRTDEQPEFVSSRRKYADALKSKYISQYVSAQN
ncbi:hypothetical protein PHYBOEH_005563 [Phytophthora boehmeriae]|uniref:Protein kinase domain-containing protein n=1 Tax=Phytophthora boehmeriae TaxID=109152 RepID=A0A8T1WR39_9STRA|nr:hypothetical protein PHYBOEH_005563 [Phytophthora boehmeriae]